MDHTNGLNQRISEMEIFLTTNNIFVDLRSETYFMNKNHTKIKGLKALCTALANVHLEAQQKPEKRISINSIKKKSENKDINFCNDKKIMVQTLRSALYNVKP